MRRGQWTVINSYKAYKLIIQFVVLKTFGGKIESWVQQNISV